MLSLRAAEAHLARAEERLPSAPGIDADMTETLAAVAAARALQGLALAQWHGAGVHAGATPARRTAGPSAVVGSSISSAPFIG